MAIGVECLKEHEFVLRFYEILEKLYALKVVKNFDSGFLSLNGSVFSSFINCLSYNFCLMHV